MEQNAPVILVVAKDAVTRKELVSQLRLDGYVILSVSDTAVATDAIENNELALIVIDLIGPWQEGLAWCNDFVAGSTSPHVPQLVIADAGTFDWIGDGVSSDGRLITPFTWMQFRVRVRLLLRHVFYASRPKRFIASEQNLLDNVIIAADLQIDTARRQVICRGQSIQLTARLFDLLVYFARRPGILLSNERILKDVWGYVPASKSLHVHIRWLREKLELDPARPTMILTVSHQGYRFADVTDCRGSSAVVTPQSVS